MNIPVPGQNSILREYVRAQKGQYALPSLESAFPNCYHQLFGLLRSIEPKSNLAMYSVTMLPKKNKLQLFIRLCKEKQVSLHFVLENLVSNEPFSNLLSEIENYELKEYESKFDYIENLFFNRN
tara:strand:+ start:222 stop:593 length:372 start_codon:yes stop_codon:yes gene_type:complete